EHVDVLAADIHAARQTSILELADEGAVGIEDLDPLILAVGHPQQSLRIERDAVGDVELTRGLPFAAPRLDEAAGLVELEHPGIATGSRRVSLRDEDIAVRADGDVVRLIQFVRPSGFVPGAGLP